MDQPRRSRASGLLRERLGEGKRAKQEGATGSGREKEGDKDDDEMRLSLEQGCGPYPNQSRQGDLSVITTDCNRAVIIIGCKSSNGLTHGVNNSRKAVPTSITCPHMAILPSNYRHHAWRNWPTVLRKPVVVVMASSCDGQTLLLYVRIWFPSRY